ncbi:MAG: hypothetical protein MR430_04385 [Lachnospiraceae bacterium]|nr:hypothetical protein [Lachnospiraceae bacterium]
MKKKTKQITAWIAVIVLILLYAATFLTAVWDFPGSDALFRSCLAASVGLPVLLWVYIWLFSKVKERRSGAVSEAFRDNAAPTEGAKILHPSEENDGTGKD